MKVLTVRIGDDLYGALEASVRASGITLSDGVRFAVERFVGGDARDGSTSGPQVPSTLTTFERSALATLHRILARVVAPNGEEGDAEYQLRLARILEQGFTAEYHAAFAAVDSEMPKRDMDFVMDVLDMFTRLSHSFSNLSSFDKTQLGEGAERAVVFRGFDHNRPRELRMAQYARFLVVEQQRWVGLAGAFDEANSNGNSHLPVLETYERMLEAYAPIWKLKIEGALRNDDASFDLTLAELQSVIRARGHPQHRASRD